MSLAVTGPADGARRDRPRAVDLLGAADFLPHQRIERAGRGAAAAAREHDLARRRTRSTRRATTRLLNLGSEPPPAFETFERVFEVVSLDDADRFAARERWKAYARRGYPIKRHEVAA